MRTNRQRIQEVNLSADLIGQGVILQVLNDADDLGSVADKIAILNVQQIADGLLARPRLLRDNIVDNDEVEIVLHVVFIEIAAGQKCDSHTLEIAWKNRAVVRHERVLLLFRSAFGPEEAVPVRESIVERQVRSDAYSFDARNASEIGL